MLLPALVQYKLPNCYLQSERGVLVGQVLQPLPGDNICHIYAIFITLPLILDAKALVFEKITNY